MYTYFLPPFSPAQSLNVSVASAVVLGIARSQGAFKADMSTEEITQLYTQWLGRTAMQVERMTERALSTNSSIGIPNYALCN